MPAALREAGKGGGNVPAAAAARPNVLVAGPNIQSSSASVGMSDADLHCATRPCEYPRAAFGANDEQTVQMTDSSVVIRTTDGTQLLKLSLWDFFYGYDWERMWGSPQVVWDRLHSHWLATRFATDCSAYSIVELGISDTADAAGSWTFYDWEGYTQDPLTPMDAPVNPQIGLSNGLIALSWDEADVIKWCSSDYYTWADTIRDGNLIVFDAAELDASPMPDPMPFATVEGGTFNELGYHPATALTADAHLPVTYADRATGALHVLVVSGSVEPIDTVTSLTLAGPTLDTWLSGPTAVISSGSTLYVGQPMTGSVSGNLALELSTITVTGSNATLAGDAVYGDAVNVEVESGSVGVAADGSAFAVYESHDTVANTTTVYAAYTAPTDTPGTYRTPAVLQQTRTGNLPGATFGMLPADASDAHSVWQAQPFADGTTGWSSWISKLTGGTTADPSGTWQVGNGSGTSRAFVVDLTTAPAAGAGATQIRISNTNTVDGSGVLAASRVFPSGGRISWDLSEVAMGGTAATGAKTLYLQFGDGLGHWSAFSSQAVTVDATVASDLVPITPVRILDSRYNNGLSGVFRSKVARSVQVTGRVGIPSDAIAVTGNVTVTAQTTAGHVTLAPTLTTGVDAPISTINFLASPDNRANGVTVGLSSSGKLAVMFVGSTSTATAHVIFDVSGYYTKSPGVQAPATMTYHPLAMPVALENTKTKAGWIQTRLRGGYVYGFWVAGMQAIPEDAVAITGVVTVPKGATEGTHLTITPTLPVDTNTSTINFKTTEERANNLTVPLGPWGSLFVYYAASTSSYCDFIFDVTGYFTADASGASYVPIAPQRILDTRPKSTSMPNNPIGVAGPLKARTAYTFAVTGKGGVPATGPVAVTGNVTITGQTAVGQLIVGPTETSGVLPAWNTLSSPTGQNRANGIVTGLNGTGKLMIMYWASSTAYTSQAIFDVSGYFK